MQTVGRGVKSRRAALLRPTARRDLAPGQPVCSPFTSGNAPRSRRGLKNRATPADHNDYNRHEAVFALSGALPPPREATADEAKPFELGEPSKCRARSLGRF